MAHLLSPKASRTASTIGSSIVEMRLMASMGMKAYMQESVITQLIPEGIASVSRRSVPSEKARRNSNPFIRLYLAWMHRTSLASIAGTKCPMTTVMRY